MSEAQIVAAGIGRKFQKPTVFEQLTVFENLELALAGTRSFPGTLRARISAEPRDQIDHVLEISGLSGDRAKAGRALTQGQKQWLEIGMLLMQNPALPLVDEPVAGMTPHELNARPDC
jgi:urea transport system ATP-binding protein